MYSEVVAYTFSSSEKKNSKLKKNAIYINAVSYDDGTVVTD